MNESTSVMNDSILLLKIKNLWFETGHFFKKHSFDNDMIPHSWLLSNDALFGVLVRKSRCELLPAGRGRQSHGNSLLKL